MHEVLEKAIVKEQEHWQNEISKLIEHLVPEANAEGCGCDSGDLLDGTMTQITQAINYLKDNPNV